MTTFSGVVLAEQQGILCESLRLLCVSAVRHSRKDDAGVHGAGAAADACGEERIHLK
jgi:hypothetical protein